MSALTNLFRRYVGYRKIEETSLLSSNLRIPNQYSFLTDSFLFSKPIVLYDGVCHLCDWTVKFILPRDKKREFRFASQQSEIAQVIISKVGLPSGLGLSVYLIEEDKIIYEKSTAMLRIIKRLSGGWPILYYIAIIFPAPLRDIVYSIIANNRYRLFGKSDVCLMPPSDYKERFLTDLQPNNNNNVNGNEHTI